MANPNPFNPILMAYAAQYFQSQNALASQSQQIPQHPQMFQQFQMNPIFAINPSMNQQPQHQHQQQFSPPWMTNYSIKQNQQLPYHLPPSGFSPYEKKFVPKVNKETAKILLDWFNAHIDNPYPEPEDRQMLRDRTGFTDTQIGDWFRNRRRNVKKSFGGKAKWEAPATGRKRRSNSFFNFPANNSNVSSASVSTTSSPTPSSTPTSVTKSNPILSALLSAKPITTVSGNANINSPSSISNDQSIADTSTDDSGFIDVVSLDSIGLNNSSTTTSTDDENIQPPEKRTKFWSINDIIE